MQACEDQPNAFQMPGWDACRGPFSKEPLQSTMTKSLYHAANVTRHVSGVKHFLSLHNGSLHALCLPRAEHSVAVQGLVRSSHGFRQAHV